MANEVGLPMAGILALARGLGDEAREPGAALSTETTARIRQTHSRERSETLRSRRADLLALSPRVLTTAESRELQALHTLFKLNISAKQKQISAESTSSPEPKKPKRKLPTSTTGDPRVNSQKRKKARAKKSKKSNKPSASSSKTRKCVTAQQLAAEVGLPEHYVLKLAKQYGAQTAANAASLIPIAIDSRIRDQHNRSNSAALKAMYDSYLSKGSIDSLSSNERAQFRYLSAIFNTSPPPSSSKRQRNSSISRPAPFTNSSESTSRGRKRNSVQNAKNVGIVAAHIPSQRGVGQKHKCQLCGKYFFSENPRHGCKLSKRESRAVLPPVRPVVAKRQPRPPAADSKGQGSKAERSVSPQRGRGSGDGDTCRPGAEYDISPRRHPSGVYLIGHPGSGRRH